MTDFDLDSLLSDILDDTKPLPGAAQPAAIISAPPAPQAEPAVANFATVSTEGFQPMSQVDAFPAPMPEAPQPVEPKGDYDLPPLQMPTFTDAEIASTIDLRNFATLTTLNTHRWHAKVKDRQASKNAAAATGATEESFEVRKNLLAGADEKLRRIHKAIDTARGKYYEMTLPWTTTGVDDNGRRSGARMLPNTQFFEFITEMGNCKAEMKAAVDDFVPAYPLLIEEAKKNLKGSFDPGEYPNAESIAGHFDLTFDFQPIPQGTDFKGLADAQCRALADALQGKTQKMIENAMQELWDRAYKAVGRMAERLSHPDKMFHGTLVENVQSVARQLKHLNVTGDVRVDKIRQYIDDHLCGLDLESLKKVPTVRARAAADAQEVLNMMARFAKGGKNV